MNWAERTIATYDNSATQLATYFQGIGSRVEDINRAVALAGSSRAERVVEIGCGDGRDAVEIVKCVDWYEGVDPSRGLLDLARQKLPDTSFIQENIQQYEFPCYLDIVFAFASLLHLSREENGHLFPRVAEALRPNGIFYVSFKESDEYEQREQHDQYGERLFFYYDVDTIKKIARPLFSEIYEDHQQRGETRWFTLALKKL